MQFSRVYDSNMSTMPSTVMLSLGVILHKRTHTLVLGGLYKLLPKCSLLPRQHIRVLLVALFNIDVVLVVSKLPMSDMQIDLSVFYSAVSS